VKSVASRGHSTRTDAHRDALKRIAIAFGVVLGANRRLREKLNEHL
jgi:hypothetical protein